MAVHDWSRVEAGIFHDFHLAWIAEIRRILNEGLLPKGYYALSEQHAGQTIADILTLHAISTNEPVDAPRGDPSEGGTLVVDAPPRVRRRQTLLPQGKRRTLAIRHVSQHRLVAMIEIVSPANKDRALHVTKFTGKIVSALQAGVHVLLVDLFPPGAHDPLGLHGAICEYLDQSDQAYALPTNEPFTLASYLADPQEVDAYLEHLAIGAALPEMPLFLTGERYVNVPLASTYDAAYRGVPEFWRDVLEQHSHKSE